MKRSRQSAARAAVLDAGESNASADAGQIPPLFGNLRHLVISGAVLLVATLIVFGKILFDGEERILSLPGGDLFTVFVGWAEFTTREMALGNLPLWNPHVFSGAPCLGGFQEALLYPPTWMHLFMPLPQAFNWGIALHVFFAGLFTYLWMARRGVHPAGALLAGFVFMFGGGYFMHISAGHLPNLRTMVWTPLIFLAIDDLTSTRSLRGAWLGAAGIAMQIFAGHVQYTYYTGLIAAPYALIRLWRAPSRGQSLAGLGLMGAGGAALSAIQLFTGLAAAGESVRSKLAYSVASTYPFPPENLLTLVFPDFFGRVSEIYWGRWFLWEDSLFIGIVALLLVIYAIARGRLRDWGALAIMAVVCLLLALGRYTPLYPLLYRIVPGFSSFRGVSKFAYLAALFISALAGIGVDWLLRERKFAKRVGFVLAAGALALAAAAVLIGYSGKQGDQGAWGHLLRNINWNDEGFQQGRLAHGIPAYLFEESAAGIATDLFWRAGACTLLAVLWFLAARDRRWIFGVGILAVFELSHFAVRNQPSFELGMVTGREQQFHQYFAALKHPDARIISGEPSVVLGAGGDDAWGNDPMVLRRYAQFMTYGQGRPVDEYLRQASPIEFNPSPTAVRGHDANGQPVVHAYLAPAHPSPLWNMVRIEAVWVPADGPGIMRPWPLAGQRLPRAQLVEDARVIDDPQRLLQTMAEAGFDPSRQVLVEQPLPFSIESANSSAAATGNITLEDVSSDEMEVTADVARPCMLLITDNYSNGWQAQSRDERPPQKYQVLCADYTLRGIPLLPGHHHFVLRYLPAGFRAGRIVSAVALLLYVMGGLLLWRRRNSRIASRARNA